MKPTDSPFQEKESYLCAAELGHVAHVDGEVFVKLNAKRRMLFGPESNYAYLAWRMKRKKDSGGGGTLGILKRV